MLLNCGVVEDSWESLGLQGDVTSPFWRRSALGFFGRNDAKAETPVLWPPHAKSWLIVKDSDAGRDWGQEEKGMTGWDGWMALLTWWTWVWVNSGSWCWTGRPGVLQFMGSQRVGYDWATELNWGPRKLIVSQDSTYIHHKDALSHWVSCWNWETAFYWGSPNCGLYLKNSALEEKEVSCVPFVIPSQGSRESQDRWLFCGNCTCSFPFPGIKTS